MAVSVEEVLAVWRAAERALAELPSGSPERPYVQVRVIRLQRIYARLTTLSAPATWNVLESARKTIDDAKSVLAEANERIATPLALGRTERLMEAWLVAEQALARLDDASPDRAALIARADHARDRYQAAIDEVKPHLSA